MIVPQRRLFLEGACYLLLGVSSGIMAGTLIHLLFPPAAPRVAAAAFGVVKTKVGVFKGLGLETFLSIFLSNLVSCAVIVGYPEAGVRLDRKNARLYINVFPKTVVFFIGFLCIVLLFPPLTMVPAFLGFLYSLLPHGTIELFAVVLAYTIPRGYAIDPVRPFPVNRAIFILFLLLLAAYLETFPP